MLNQNDKFERFAEVINKNAEKQCKEIKAQMEQIQEEEIQKLQSRIDKEFDSKLSYELSKMKAQSNHDFSEKSSVTRKYLIEYRDQITAKVFEKAEAKLTAFAAGEMYEKFLITSLTRLSDGLCENFTAYVRESDVKLMKKLTKDFKFVIAVKASDEVKIGGIIAKNESETVVVNDSLFDRMMDQKDWFMTTANLEITA
ncbi:MAG: V-type ATP synthase subunit E [Clostridia bacterium]